MSNEAFLSKPSFTSFAIAGIDADHTGVLKITMWGQKLAGNLNGVDIPIQGDNRTVVVFDGRANTDVDPRAVGILGPETVIYGNNAENLIFGSPVKSNFLNGFGGFDDLWGGDADDFFVYDGNADRFVGQGGTDTILSQTNITMEVFTDIRWFSIENIQLRSGFSVALTATGNDRPNGLYGNEFDNVLNGLGGDDELHGRAGDDVLNGGVGRDKLFGNAGDDTLNGDAGTDRLAGGAGNDTLDGGGSLDWMLWYANQFNTADMAAGTKDTVVNGAGDRLNFTAAMEALLNHAGTSLGNAATDVAIGSQFGDGGNVRFADGQLQIDLNSDGQFIAADDFAIALGGVTTVTYNAQGDYFLLG